MSTLAQPRQDPVEEARRLLTTGGTKGGNSYYACSESASRQALELLTASGGAASNDDQVQALCSRAYRWLGDIENAWSLLGHLTDADSHELFAEAGWLAVDLEEFEAAREHFNVVLDREPALPDAISGMVSALLAADGPSAAHFLVDRLVRDSAISTFGEHAERGWIHIADEEYEAAMEEFETSLSEQPESLDATLGLVVSLRDLGRYAEAERVCKEIGARFQRAQRAMSIWVGSLWHRTAMRLP